MKKLAFAALALVILLALSSCVTPQPTKSASELVLGVLESQPLPNAYTYRSDASLEGELLDEDLVGSYYGDLFEKPDLAKITEYYVCIDEEPLKPQELGVFVTADEETANALAEFIEARFDRLEENARNYPSIDASGIKNGEVRVSGKTVVYAMLCENCEQALSALSGN